jgi:RNA polymerase sigma-70 factor, ECF subfamily
VKRSTRETPRRARPVASPAPERDARNDRELVYAARLGDTGAFDALFYRYRDGIYRLSLAITKDPQAADEIVVDTFARAYRALARLEPDDTLRPWLYRVAINESYDRRPRSGTIATPLEDAADEVTASEERSPASIAEREETRRVVLAAIDSLDDKHRTVVVLHYLSELALAEIALIVGSPVGTVKSRLHYALRRLRTHLSAHPGLAIEPPPNDRAIGTR